MSRYLIEGARKYLEENGHSAISLERELLERRARVLREETELQILEMQLAGMRGIQRQPTPPPAAAPTTPPPESGTLDKAEKEFRAYIRSQQRARVPRDERHRNYLTKCREVLERDESLRSHFRSPDDLLAYFAKRIL